MNDERTPLTRWRRGVERRPAAGTGAVLVAGLLLAGEASMAHGFDLRRWPDGGGAAVSRAVQMDGLVFVSTTGPTGPDGTIAAGDVKAQTRQVLDNLARTLESAGTSLARAASVHVYLRRAADFAAMNEVYATYWAADPPARTTIVAALSHPDALVEMSAVGIAAGAPREVVHPAAWVRSPNPYSYGIRSGDTLFLSGLVARSGRDNSLVQGDIAAQTKVVLDNAREVLAAAGMGPGDIVSSRVFITDASLFASMNAAYRSFFTADPPPRATVVCELMNPAFQVEITFVAVRGAAASRRVFGPPGPQGPPFSRAIAAGGRVFVAGMLGVTPDTRADMGAQTRQTLASVGKALNEAGLGWSDVVEAVVYVSDMSRAAAMEAAWREVFAASPPARVLTGTRLVNPDGLVEIMVTAAERAGSR
jgi:2-iminobutanoate/2-iminopropanoate deaminase